MKITPLKSLSALSANIKLHQPASTRPRMLEANIGIALESLWANRLRSLLTTLGVIIGVAAVVTSVTLTQGASTLINGEIASLGTNVLTIEPGAAVTNGVSRATGSEQALTREDAQALSSIPHVTAVSPVLALASLQVSYGSKNWSTRGLGVSASFQSIQNWRLAHGTWFTAQDESDGIATVVLGQSVASHLFDTSGIDPVGQIIRVRDQLFHVVGVLRPKGAVGSVSQDDVIFLPLTTAITRLNNARYVDQVLVQASGDAYLNEVQQDITNRLRLRHHVKVSDPADFQVHSINQLVQTAQEFTQTLAALLIGIAAISLTVGGIGIMNIMLVSVTERTREIGIRMAIGAQRSDVRNQFLIESVTLSALGGSVGILIGLTMGLILTNTWNLPFVLSLPTILLAFGVSTAVGVIFGLYPAIRAARLDPIVALRVD